MVRKYILIKSKKTKKVLGAIPIKLRATTSQIKKALSELKKYFLGKIVTGSVLKKLKVKIKKKKPVKRKTVKRRKKPVRRRKKPVRRRKKPVRRRKK